MTRRRDDHLQSHRKPLLPPLNLDDSYSRPSEAIPLRSSNGQTDDFETATSAPHKPKIRKILGLSFITPNTSRYANRSSSRTLRSFPFLVEVIYLGIACLFSTMVTSSANHVLTETAIWDVASDHAVAILEIEELSWLSFLFPLREIGVQYWLTEHHPWLLWLLTQIYLLHNACTIGLLAYFYACLRKSTFAIVRRTMALTSLLGFMSFLLYPCAPPRLLPLEYGFADPVYGANRAALWVSDVTLFSAISSLKLANALITGAACFWHSGIFRKPEAGRVKKSKLLRSGWVIAGLAWVMLSLIAGVASGDEFWFGALVGLFFVSVAGVCNRFLLLGLPALDLLAWAVGVDMDVDIEESLLP